MILSHNVLVVDDVVAATNGTVTAVIVCVTLVAFSIYCVKDANPALHQLDEKTSLSPLEMIK